MRRSRGIPPRSARGFTMVEALIALLVLSVGLLGVAALQLASLRSNTSAAQRSQATFLAYDIADRMRANREAALAGAYDTAYGDAAPAAPATVAQRDLAAWLGRVGAVLPRSAADGSAAQAQIERDGEVFTISLRWDDTRGAEGLLQFQMQTRI